VDNVGKQIGMQPVKDQLTKELSLLCRKWDEAIVTNDVVEIGKYMSADWVIIGTEGGITPKSHFLDFIKSGDLFHNKMDFDDIRVVEYGDAAIVISKGTSSGTYKGEPFSYYEWSTNVFIKKDGHWLCVLTMLTPAEKKPL
jgi:ketosteroid isomerase-like protein